MSVCLELRPVADGFGTHHLVRHLAFRYQRILEINQDTLSRCRLHIEVYLSAHHLSVLCAMGEGYLVPDCGYLDKDKDARRTSVLLSEACG